MEVINESHMHCVGEGNTRCFRFFCVYCCYVLCQPPLAAANKGVNHTLW